MTTKSFCSWFLLLGIIYVSNAEPSFQCYPLDNPSLSKFFRVPLSNPSGVQSYFENKVNITLYTYGLNGTVNGPATSAILQAYLTANANRNDVAICVIDWEEEARVIVSEGEYVFVRKNSEEVGVKVGGVLCGLVKNGVSNVFRLIAHSVGVQLMTIAARTFKNCTNTLIPSLTGLDTAAPLNFDGPQPNDAAFVVGLHTNPGQFGEAKPFGNVDFWVNCNNNSTQPGCTSNLIELFLSKEARLCSHTRSVFIYAEVIKSKYAFPAVCVLTCSVWRSQSAPTTRINYLGELTDPTITGNCFFSTKSSSPYSKGQDGIKPN